MRRLSSIPEMRALMFLAFGSTAFLSACAADTTDEDLSSTQETLYLTGGRWPTNSNGVHTVPVCFSSDSMARPDFTTVRDNIHRAVNNTWGRNANIQFTGFGECGLPFGKLGITITTAGSDGEKGKATVGAPSSDWELSTMTITSGAPQGLIAHEFGHVLGFSHEMSRPDFKDDDSGKCRESDIWSGNTLGTPRNDRESIMAGWPYCGGFPDNLSTWDIVGVQKAYGRKLRGSVVGLENRCLDVPGAQFVNGNTPTLFDCQGGDNQNWTHAVNNDRLSVSGGGVLKCLDVPGANNADGTAPTLYDCHGGTNQSWSLKGVAIRGFGGKCLERSGGSLANGTPISITTCNNTSSSQTWTLTPAGEIRTGDGGAGSKCIDVPGGNATNGTQLTLYDCHGGTNQKFAMGLFGQLRTLNKCMGVVNDSPNDGTAVGIFDCSLVDPRLPNQWATSGHLVSLGKCLDVPGANSFNGATPKLAACSTQVSQSWDFYW